MKLDLSQVIGLIVIAAGVFHLTGGQLPLINPTPSPAIEAPAPELQSAVLPVRSLVAGKPEAPGLSAFFAAVADDIGRTDSTLTSVGQVLSIVKAGRPLMYAPGQTTTIAGLPEAVKAFLAAQLGDESPLDAAKRAKAVAAFKALAWACT